MTGRPDDRAARPGSRDGVVSEDSIDGSETLPIARVVDDS
jgi:hypothetical protein